MPSRSTPPLPLPVAAVVLDCDDPRRLAGFYAELLDWEIDESHSTDTLGTVPCWVELADPTGGTPLACVRVADYRPPTWGTDQRPKMAHLDIGVPDLAAGSQHAVGVGARPVPQPADRLDADFRVFLDPAGHPFCLVHRPLADNAALGTAVDGR